MKKYISRQKVKIPLKYEVDFFLVFIFYFVLIYCKLTPGGNYSQFFVLFLKPSLKLKQSLMKDLTSVKRSQNDGLFLQ